tara:strand:+ start:92 stop:313 length:222 start_codon:yes stop_codon:yes gene_type:complete
MPKNTLDLAMLITDEILNEFESKGVLHIPLDENKYSFPLQDRIQIALEKISNKDIHSGESIVPEFLKIKRRKK